MTAEIVNLRQVRKAKARAQERREADANRAKHGRTKAERNHAAAESERVQRLFDAHRRDDGDPA